MARRVVVVGGGAIGLLCAYYLRRAGAEVVVVERGTIGAGCSAGNAGWVVPALATPIPAPGLRSVGLRWLFRRDSPLYLEPSAVPQLAPWLWRFWLACTEEAFARGAEALLAHAADAVELYQELADDGVDFEWHRDGLVMAFHSRQALDHEIEIQERFDCESPRVLSADALCDLEPNLSSAQGALAGGLHLERQAHVRPETVTSAVAVSCEALGVEIRPGFPVDGLRFEGRVGKRRARELFGPEGAIEADDFVLATGAELGRLARQCDVRIPMQAAKGYSVTVEEPAVEIRRPLHLAEAKMALSPFAGALRVAGTLELSGINQRLDRRRLVGFERSAERAMPGVFAGVRRTEWVGMRPLTPDGLPVLGRLPEQDNVWVSGGHQMLGITLAPASGKALASAVLDGGSGDVPGLELFSPQRFA